MTTRYSKDKYARIKSLKNEPLSHITPGSKKCKLDEGKDETSILKSLFGTPSSPTPSLEMMTFSPLTMRSKKKAKIGKSVWNDPGTTLGQAHNVVTDDELRRGSFVYPLSQISQSLHSQTSTSISFNVSSSLVKW